MKPYELDWKGHQLYVYTTMYGEAIGRPLGELLLDEGCNYKFWRFGGSPTATNCTDFYDAQRMVETLIRLGEIV